MTKPTRTFAQLCAVVCVNEVWPREKKYKCTIAPELVGVLVRREFDKAITRKQLRDVLDLMFLDQVQN